MDNQDLTLLPHDELVKQINRYSSISRERPLTESEASDRQKLREEYLRRIRINLRGQLEGIEPLNKGGKNGYGKKNN